MMIFALILMVSTGSGLRVERLAEFDTLSACQSAADAIVTMFKTSYTNPRALCIAAKERDVK